MSIYYKEMPEYNELNLLELDNLNNDDENVNVNDDENVNYQEMEGYNELNIFELNSLNNDDEDDNTNYDMLNLLNIMGDDFSISPLKNNSKSQFPLPEPLDEESIQYLIGETPTSIIVKDTSRRYYDMEDAVKIPMVAPEEKIPKKTGKKRKRREKTPEYWEEKQRAFDKLDVKYRRNELTTGEIKKRRMIQKSLANRRSRKRAKTTNVKLSEFLLEKEKFNLEKKVFEEEKSVFKFEKERFIKFLNEKNIVHNF